MDQFIAFFIFGHQLRNHLLDFLRYKAEGFLLNKPFLGKMLSIPVEMDRAGALLTYSALWEMA